MKKLLYLSDLYNFYVSQNKNVKFSSKDDDTTIVVHIDLPFTYSEIQDDDLNLYAPIKICHTEDNINKSYISEKAMKKAIDTAYEIPVLGYIYPDPDDEEQYTFAGHEFYVNDNDEVVYEESPIGVISNSKKLELVYDKDMDKTYLEGVAKIWRTYTKAAEILEREKKFWVSAELCVDELSFDSKNKLLVIDEFRFSGVTILGKSREDGSEIKPGMVGSNISISDFSEQNNSVFSQNEKVIEMLSALSEKIDNLNINQKFKQEGGHEQLKKEFKEKPEDIKDTPSTKIFDDGDPDGGDGGDGIDYYDPLDGNESGEGGDNPTGEEQPEVIDPNTGYGTTPGSDDPPADPPTDPVNEPTQEDIDAANAVTTEIDGLSNSSTAEEVSAARAAYEALSAEGKTLVTAETLAKLEAQETRIANQEAADTVTAMITALTDTSSAEDVAAARAAYEALTTDQKALVSAETLALLEAQETRLDEEAADAVSDMIDALTDESTAAEVQAAREAYDALTEAQKELVDAETLAKLEEQEERIANESVSNDDIAPKKKRRNNNSLEVKYSVECKDEVKTHFATLSEKLAALSDLVNITYGETDDTYYLIDADEDKKLVYMHDIWRDKHYRQSYSVKKDVYSLKGDRCELFARYLSQDEINEFEKMKSNYSSVVDELASFKAEPDKEEILAKKCYKKIAEVDAFKELCKKENHFSMSVEEVEIEADKILLEYAKGDDLKFSANDSEKKSVGVKLFGNPSKKSTKGSSRYGGLFSK